MRAVKIHGKESITLEELPIPQPRPGQVLIKVAYVGICGSDLHYYFDGYNGTFVVKEPLIPGHEFSGVVVQAPGTDLAPGTNVAVHPAQFGPDVPGLEDRPYLRAGGSYLGSASTWPHTQGGMAEYLVVEAGMIRVLPDGLSLYRAALAEPLAVALHGINIAGDIQGKSVLISGAGPIGLLSAFAAQERGAASVTMTDVLAEPLQQALKIGADAVIQIGEAEVPSSQFDISIECSGAIQALSTAIEATKPAGIVVMQGMAGPGPQPIVIGPAMNKELQLRGSFRFHDEITDAVEILARSPHVEQVITHTFAAADVVEAFEMARDSSKSSKVLVQMDEGATT